MYVTRRLRHSSSQSERCAPRIARWRYSARIRCARLCRSVEARWEGNREGYGGGDRVCCALLSIDPKKSISTWPIAHLSGPRCLPRMPRLRAPRCVLFPWLSCSLFCLGSEVCCVCVTFDGVLSSASRFARACSLGAVHGVD